MSAKGNPTTGYKYSMDILMGLCRGPIDSILEICVGGMERNLYWGDFDIGDVHHLFLGNQTNRFDTPHLASNTNNHIAFNAPDLFGGDTSEGGIVGDFYLFGGMDDQELDDSFTSEVSPNSSQWRGTANCFYRGTVSSNNPYPKPWMFRVQRVLYGWMNDTVWYPEKAVVFMEGWDWNKDPNDDLYNTWFQAQVKGMNGAHVIYECATNADWGRGLDPSLIDDASFRTAADTLFGETFGVCFLYDRKSALQSFVSEVINTIGGALYFSRVTGLLTLKLFRQDYDLSGVPTFDYNSGILSITNDQQNTRDTSFNEMVVQFQSPLMNDQRQVRVADLGSIAATGRRLPTTKSYRGIAVESLAARVGLRDLQAQAAGIRRMTITFDRRGWKIEPGSVFAIRVPDRNIDFMIMRAAKVTVGPVTAGTVQVDCVQDVFGLPDTAYVTYAPPVWGPPNLKPLPMIVRAVGELTYVGLVRLLGPANAAMVDENSAYIATLGVRPTSTSLRYRIDLSADGGTTYALTGRGDFTPNGLTTSALGPGDLSVILGNTIDTQKVAAGMALQIENEICRVDAWDPATGTATIARGCVDTLPASHAEGVYGFVTTLWTGTDSVEYASGETLSIKLLTQTSSGVLAEAAAPTDVITTVGRQGRPYPPGAFQINGNNFWATFVVSGLEDTVLTWTHRDRLTQEDTLVDQSEGDVGPEPGTTYNLRFYNGLTLLRSETTAGTTFTYTAVMDLADSHPNPLTVELESTRDGLISYQKYHVQIMRSAGYGDGYGEDYGDGLDTGFGSNFGNDFGN